VPLAVCVEFIPRYFPLGFGLSGPTYENLKAFPGLTRAYERDDLFHQLGVFINGGFEFS